MNEVDRLSMHGRGLEGRAQTTLQAQNFAFERGPAMPIDAAPVLWLRGDGRGLRSASLLPRESRSSPAGREDRTGGLLGCLLDHFLFGLRLAVRGTTVRHRPTPT